MPLRMSKGASERFQEIATENGAPEMIEQFAQRLLAEGVSEDQVNQYLQRKFGIPQDFRANAKQAGLLREPG